MEANETIGLSLSNPNNGLKIENVLGAELIDTHVYTITNDDTATVTIAADADADEATAHRSFILTLSAAAEIDVDVSYALTGTAVKTADYTDETPVNGTVTIPAGNTSAIIDLAIIDDAFVEETETVIATLTATTSSSGITADTTPATLNITDNDTTFVTIAADIDALESEANRSFTLTLDQAVFSDVDVTYSLSGSATDPDDYSDNTAVVGTVTIPQGATMATIAISVVDDNLVEADETIVASLQAMTSSSIVTSDTAPITMKIMDNDEILVSIATDADADEATMMRSFTISLAAPAAIPVDIDYVLSGSAIDPDDYSDLSGGSVTIPSGDLTAEINLEIVDDNLVEGLETIEATISSTLSAVTIVQAVATLNVLDNDSCTAPMNPGVSDVQITTVDLSWAMPANVAVEGYEWVIVATGEDPVATVPAAFDFSLDNELSVDDAGILVKDRTYDFYVRTICSPVASSAFAGPISFTTLPDNDDDGIPDDLDPDDDNDGTPDSEEGSATDDCDNDGIKDSFDPDPCTISVQDIATAFTPNGDGLNDTWVIKGIENFPNSVINVYNRWGNEVYKAVGYQNDWGAIYRDNIKKLPPGSYYFLVNLNDGTAPIDGWLFINY